jgi:hypothetical protein
VLCVSCWVVCGDYLFKIFQNIDCLCVLFGMKNRESVFRCKVRWCSVCLRFYVFLWVWKGVSWCCLMLTRYLGIRGWWRDVHGLRFFLHCGCPVNFPDVSEVAKFQAGLLCSCGVERINPVRGAGYGLRWWVSSCKEETLLSVLLHFHSSYFDRM